jgi:acyl-CoA synthetase (AMP-forming)/AMP-acid ligase II
MTAPPAASAQALLARDFGDLSELIRRHAAERGDHPALIEGDRTVTYAGLDRLMDRIAAGLQRDGGLAGDAVAICTGLTRLETALAFVGALRAGMPPAPMAPSSTPRVLARMVQDSAARVFFLDAGVAEALADQPRAAHVRVALDGSAAGVPFEDWLAPQDAAPVSVPRAPQDPFNIIYSSGTTGVPKGIVQNCLQRWNHLRRGVYPEGAVTLISTPLYSNTTLVSFLPTLANGRTVVLMPKFDPQTFLELAQRYRVTHAMLVPVQYRRLLERPDFDAYDLSAFQMKTATSAPFPAELKAEVLRRWPGGLTEYYGMTEGGGTCALEAHLHPDKLHTVGRPMPGHDMRLIDEHGVEVAPGGTGEVVGRSTAMMSGYRNQPELTRKAEWFSPEGLRYIRTGDVGRFDADGFLILMDRKKDMIISGGFNIYPSDLEAETVRHPAVAEAAVVGAPSERWGETPVAFVTLAPGQAAEPEAIRDWVNARLGRTQRLAEVRILAELPRSGIGKVLKRELREACAGLSVR